MKKKNIAMLMAMTMITSGVTAPMEAVYASDEVQIQSEDAFESESGDAEQSWDEEIEIREEESDAEENFADAFSDGAEDTATHSSEVVEDGSTDAGNAVYRLYADGTLAIDGAGAFVSLKFQGDSRIISYDYDNDRFDNQGAGNCPERCSKNQINQRDFKIRQCCQRKNIQDQSSGNTKEHF